MSRRGWHAVPVAIAWYLALVAPLRAETLWIENAENGLANVIDGTDPSYPLIQSEVVGQGDFAFHLANPNFQDNYFTIDRTITVAADSQLFFLSRLRSATPQQFARVQISTDGGYTWPTNIYNQPGSGSGSGGEGAFRLKQIDLSGYANQPLRFRFYYDFTGGSAFTQTSSTAGWFVDDIQVGSEFAKIPWSIGNPSPHAQLYLEYINRARADAQAEAVRLANESDPQIQLAYSGFGITGASIQNQFDWYIDSGAMARHAQPLSFQAELNTAAELHAQDQFNQQFQGHNSSTSPPAPFPPGASLGQRATAVGYDYSSLAENVFSYSKSVPYGHAGFDVDWGNTSNPGSTWYNPAFAGQGMQNPAGHRRNIHNPNFKEIGIGVVNGTNGSVGPQVVTQDFGVSGDVRYITGVVYEDLNGNEFYDLGEGRPGVRIDVDNSPFYAISTASGGYSVPVNTDGTYNVSFTGGSFQSYTTTATVFDGLNVKVDYLAIQQLALPGDFNNDNIVDAADYTVWRDGFGSQYTLDDYADWKNHFGQSSPSGAGSATASVPEPGAATLAFAAIFLALAPARPTFSGPVPCGRLS